jgi:hypothetical protein
MAIEFKFFLITLFICHFEFYYGGSFEGYFTER